jgi:Phage related hypothetical protein (DUF1799).
VEHLPARAQWRARKKLKAAAQALFAEPPTPEELAVFGLLPEDMEDTAVDVWPDNYPAVLALIAMDTQWRVGPSGPTGLDYTALPFVLRMHAVPRGDWPDTFDRVRVLEAEALSVMRKKK